MRYTPYNKKIKYSAGFSIVETLVAVTIFSIALVAMISISASGLSGVSASRSALTAKYLAQEGIEIVRNIRDTEIVANASNQGVAWTSFSNKIFPCSDPSGNGCNIDPLDLVANQNNGGVMACPLGNAFGCTILVSAYTGSSLGSGYYGTSPGVSHSSPSGFYRKITVDTSNPAAAVITSTVTWQQGFSTKSATMTETLFNWKF